MSEPKREDENEYFNYYLEVGEDGLLYAVTEYETLITCWHINASIEIDNIVYLISL